MNAGSAASGARELSLGTRFPQCAATLAMPPLVLEAPPPNRLPKKFEDTSDADEVTTTGCRKPPMSRPSKEDPLDERATHSDELADGMAADAVGRRVGSPGGISGFTCKVKNRRLFRGTDES